MKTIALTISILMTILHINKLNAQCNISADYTYTTNGYTVDFTHTSSNYPPYVNWEWYFDDGGHVFTMNANHTYTVQGSYEVCLFASYSDSINGGTCIDTMCKVITVPDFTSGINIPYTMSGFIMYPNPAKESVTIEKGDNTGIMNIKIINTLGQTEMEFATNEIKYVIDLHRLPKGIYIVQIQADTGEMITKTLMKH